VKEAFYIEETSGASMYKKVIGVVVLYGLLASAQSMYLVFYALSVRFMQMFADGSPVVKCIGNFY
jgi:hypothetical protein